MPSLRSGRIEGPRFRAMVVDLPVQPLRRGICTWRNIVMGWRDLAWTDCSFPVPPERIHDVERTLRVQFPQDFRECVRECNGGTPSKRNFRVPATGIEFRSCLAVLLS